MRITEEQDRWLNDKMVNTLLSMINMLNEDEKAFIKANIRFKDDKDFPLMYYKLIDGSEWTRAELMKKYGTIWIFNEETNELKKIIKDIEPIPRGFKPGYRRKDKDSYISE